MNKWIMSIGWILLAIGVSCADSEHLMIPIVMVVVGSLMMYFGSKERRWCRWRYQKK